MCIRIKCSIALAAVFLSCGCTKHVSTGYKAVDSPHGVGIALAGGGTKAASYAMGVLAGVADTKEGFSQIDAVSSVSGGGYSAYYLYSKLLVRERDKSKKKPEIKDFFSDCIPDVYESILPPAVERSQPLCKEVNIDNFRFQQFVRCRQDVFENDCKQQLRKGDGDEYVRAGTNFLFIVGATAIMEAPVLLSNTVFDWPVNLSASRYDYMNGIGTAYGLYPLNTAALAETPNIASSCEEGNFLNCKKTAGVARVDSDELTFENLRKFMRSGNEKVPLWYINATASKSRSIFGWAKKGQRDFTKYTLQMSPFEARSGLYGKVEDYEQHLDLLKGVTAAAAFLDANETAVQSGWGRMPLALLQHLTGFDWGVDIPNPNVATGWRVLHNHLPVPFYYLDGTIRYLTGHNDANEHSAYIRLLDGGNNDNLGAYTLIEKGMKDLVISDDAQDRKKFRDADGKKGYLAVMQDVCRLHNEIELRSSQEKHRRKLVVPGLENFDRHCDEFRKDSEGHEGAGGDGDGLPEGGYSILEWKHNVLLGCITAADEAGTCDNERDVRVYVLKPALDLPVFISRYLDGQPGHYKVKKNACSADEAGPCEVAAYIADWYNDNGKDAVLHGFPQDGTVVRTFASTGRIYGAYRELARWQMHEALDLLRKKGDGFTQQMLAQGAKPVPRKSFKQDMKE